MSESISKKCPRCDRKFKCMNSAECWCSKYPTFKDDRYKDCLCESCLKELTTPDTFNPAEKWTMYGN